MQNKTERYRAEAQQCYRDMLTKVHALGVYKVEGTIPGTTEHIVLNGNSGLYPGQPSRYWAHSTVVEDAEALIRKAQNMYLGGPQAAPVTLTWKSDCPSVTL